MPTVYIISTATLQNGTFEWILSPKAVVHWLYCSETSRVCATSDLVIRDFRVLTRSYKCLIALNLTVTSEVSDLEEFVTIHLYCIDFPWHIPWNASTRANEISGKSSVSCANDQLAQNFAHMQRATMCNIWPYIFLVPPPTKNRRHFDCCICITAHGMMRTKSPVQYTIHKSA